MRRVAIEQSAFVQRLTHQADVALCQIAHPAVHEFGGFARGAFGEILSFDEQGAIAARGGIDRGAQAGRAAADYDHVPRGIVIQFSQQYIATGNGFGDGGGGHGVLGVWTVLGLDGKRVSDDGGRVRAPRAAGASATALSAGGAPSMASGAASAMTQRTPDSCNTWASGACGHASVKKRSICEICASSTMAWRSNLLLSAASQTSRDWSMMLRETRTSRKS